MASQWGAQPGLETGSDGRQHSADGTEWLDKWKPTHLTVPNRSVSRGDTKEKRVFLYSIYSTVFCIYW